MALGEGQGALGAEERSGNVAMISINPAVSLLPMSHHLHRLVPLPLYFQPGWSDGVPRHLDGWMDEPPAVPRLDCSPACCHLS